MATKETPPPTFGAVEDLMLGILRPFFQGHAVTITTEFYNDMRLPAVIPVHVPRSGEMDQSAEDGWTERATVEMNTLCDGLEAERDNAQLQEACKHALILAQKKQLMVPGVGVINRIASSSMAVRQQDMGQFSVPHGAVRYKADYRLLLRPDRSASNPYTTPAP